MARAFWISGRTWGALALAFLLMVPVVAEAQDPPSDDRPGVAVLRFENGGSFGPEREDYGPLEVGLQQIMLTELAQNSAFRMVERSTLNEILAEQDLAVRGHVDPQTAARIGRLVGARYTITGQFMDNWGEMRLDARIVDVETGEILTAQQVRDRRERLYDLMVALAAEITEHADLPPLAREVREAREAREIPAEAVILFSRAQTYEDFGDRDRAIEAYQRIVNEFPQMTEAREALEQISGS